MGESPLPDPLDRPVPTDPALVAGTLPNGLRYFVRPNREPAGRAALRLVVDAGSVLEDPDQEGLAHFVEHMAFNGTAHFPGNSQIRALEAIGVTFGPDLGGTTTFDDTTYRLFVPTDPSALDLSFRVMRDWADGLRFDPVEVEKERGVVIEEWRQSLDVAQRLRDLTDSVLFAGSPYAGHRPLGTEKGLQTFEPGAAERFYRNWYHPERMAVIAVGDFDTTEIVDRITDTFASVAPANDPRERVRPLIPEPATTRYVLATEPGLGVATLRIDSVHDDRESGTHRGYREDLILELGYNVWVERLVDRYHEPDRPFLGVWARPERLTPAQSTDVLSAEAAPEQIESAYAALLLETRRFREAGVTEAEVARAHATVLARYATLARTANTQDSRHLADELGRHYLFGEPVPGAAAEVALAERWVPEIGTAEISAWATSLLSNARVVRIAAPRGVPDAARLDRIAQDVDAAAVPPLDRSVLPEDLLARPAPGAIVAIDRTYEASLGFVGYDLSNGVRVWAKRTDFSSNEVLFGAFSPGGWSRVADEDLPAAKLLTRVVEFSGIGPLDAAQLRHWTSGKTVTISPWIGETAEGIDGVAAPADLDDALQMVAGMFRMPRLTGRGFAGAVDLARAELAARATQPTAVLDEAVRKQAWPSPRMWPWTAQQIDTMTLDQVRRVYKARFSRANDFTFVFVGALPPDFEELLTVWLGTLPTGPTETAADLGVRQRPGRQQATLHVVQEPLATLHFAWRGRVVRNTYTSRLAWQALRRVLEVRLRDEIREELGGTYNVYVTAHEDFEPIDWYEMHVDLTCDPQRVDDLQNRVEAVVADLRVNGPSETLVAQVRTELSTTHAEALRTNPFWLHTFVSLLRHGEAPTELLHTAEQLAAVTPSVLRALARAQLVETGQITGMTLPNPTLPSATR